MAARSGAVSEQGLFPAEHRALRELYATSRQLASHWRRLAERLGDPPAAPLRAGAEIARGLLDELADRTARHGLHGFPAAQTVGMRIAGVRNTALDLLFERNQALRLALLDAQHVLNLLAYLRALAEQRGDHELAAFHERWVKRLAAVEADARAAMLALAADPDGAIEPAEGSMLGRAGRGLGSAVGTVGEAIDGSVLGRAARRRATRS